MQDTLTGALAGRYTIDREIGRGGMATVFLAQDVRHHRRVALKVLNPELGAVLGVERFLAEIEVTANLQHPNLLPLFDSGEASGLLFYVMPYVEGESLRARLEREKQLPVDEAVRIAAAIGGALDYAHRRGVIHRDLKPENVLMHEGQPLIADFGIALAVSNAGGSRITQTGLSLGTPQYMSPEQATGDRAVDGRTDVYSLAAMTYEMLVGDPPHSASTSQAIIAKVLTERPPGVRAGRPNAPPHVEAAIARALEKLPADRFATAREFVEALEGKGTHATAGTVPAATSRRKGARELVAWSLVALLGAWAAWATWGRAGASVPVEAPVVRANFDLPPGARINDVLPGATLALSPRGDMFAFTAIDVTGFKMYLRRLDQLSARLLQTAAGRNLTFSPDGRWLAYTEGNVLRKVSVEGGEPVTLSTTGGAVPYGMVWSEQDTLYIGSFSGMYAVPAGGGTAEVLRASDADSTRLGRRRPALVPGGRALVYVSGNSSSANSRLSVLDLDTRRSEEFETAMASPLGFLGDQLVYVSPAGALMALRFDVDALRPVGDPVQLEEGLMVDATTGVKATLSPSGSIVFLKGRAQLQPVLVTRGSAEPKPLIREPGAYANPRFSPDGMRVAITVGGTSATDAWIYDVRRNTFTRVTSEGFNLRPEWTADGKSIVYISVRGAESAIYRQAADGSSPAELLYRPEYEAFEAFTSPDMKWLVYRTAPGMKFSRDILAVPLEGEKVVREIVTGPNTESLPRLSRDGRWLAYQSSESNRFEIYVRPFPGPGARVQVSDLGGTEPIWDRDGRKLYYRGPVGEIVEVDVSTSGDFSIGERRVVLTGDYLTDSTHPSWDVAPDGQFLLLRRAGAESQTVIVHNWGRELREKTAPRR